MLRPRCKPHLDSVLGGQADYLPLSLEQAIFLRDGNQDRYFLPRVLRIRSDSGELLGAAVVLSDVTKFHLLDQLKSDMISTVSHELKTPLTSLQMVVHLLLEEAVGPLTTKQTELLLAARQDSDRLLGMINDLLDLTRIEQGRVALDQQPADAADLVRDALERYQSAAEDAGVTLQSKLDDHLASGAGRPGTNRACLRQPDDQLPPAYGAWWIDHLEAAAGEGTVQFSVADTGEGIPPQFIPRVFDKFFRTPAPNTRAEPGSAWPSYMKSLLPTADRSALKAPWAKGPSSPSPCLPLTGRKPMTPSDDVDLVQSASVSESRLTSTM